MLEILRQIIREPTLPGSEFEVMKNEQTAGIEQGRSDPIRQGLNHILRLLSRFSSDDVRYVPTLDEQVERVKKVTIDQVRTLHRDYLGGEHGELVIVGDFEPSEVLPILARTFEDWKSDKPYKRVDRPFQAGLKPERETVRTLDKANAVFVAGLTLPIRDDHPDYPALLAGNFILGGGALSSRIADRLRQKGGLSYTAMSMVAASPLDARADMMILAIYNPTNVDKVVTGVEEELARLLRDGVTTDELDKAKTGYLQQQQNQRTNDLTVSLLLSENLFVGRSMQFQADLEEKIRALTPAVVEAALRKHIDPKQLSIVTAGDFKR